MILTARFKYEQKFQDGRAYVTWDRLDQDLSHMKRAEQLDQTGFRELFTVRLWTQKELFRATVREL
jgi:hypothetical protein